MDTCVYRFGNEEIEVPSDLSYDDVRKAWTEIFPSLENAIAEKQEDGSVEFKVQAGTKG